MLSPSLQVKTWSGSRKLTEQKMPAKLGSTQFFHCCGYRYTVQTLLEFDVIHLTSYYKQKEGKMWDSAEQGKSMGSKTPPLNDLPGAAATEDDGAYQADFHPVFPLHSQALLATSHGL